MDIRPHRSGCTVVIDNGHGMSAPMMVAKLCDFGASGKLLGEEGNLGSGPKIQALEHSRAGVQFFSKQGGRCYLLEWGEFTVDDGLAEFGAIEQDLSPGEKRSLTAALEAEPGMRASEKRELADKMCYVKHVECPKELASYASGTMVIVKGVKYDPQAFLEFLNNRILKPTKAVRVWRDVRGELKPTPVQGIVPLLHSIFEEKRRGVVECPNATVYWGITVGEEELKKRLPFGFKPEAFYLGWNGLCYKSNPLGRGGQSRLGRWGITFGTQRVVLVVVAKGRGIRPQPNRLDFMGWDQDEAIVQWMKHFPDELDAWIDEAKQSTYNPESLEEEVKRYLDIFMRRLGAKPGVGGLGVGNSVITSTAPKHRNPFKRGKGQGGGGGGGSGGGTSDRLGRGLKPGWSTNQDMGGARILIRGEFVVLNKEHPDYKLVFDDAGSSLAKHKLMAIMAADAMAHIIRCAERRGVHPRELPEEAVLDCTSGNTLGLWYLNAGDDRMHTPRKKRR